MMNYVATSIVACMTNIMRGQASSLGTLNKATKAGWFPVILGLRYTINIIVVIVLTFVMYAYLRFSKQGMKFPSSVRARTPRGTRVSTSAASRCARC